VSKMNKIIRNADKFLKNEKKMRNRMQMWYEKWCKVSPIFHRIYVAYYEYIEKHFEESK